MAELNARELEAEIAKLGTASWRAVAMWHADGGPTAEAPTQLSRQDYKLPLGVGAVAGGVGAIAGAGVVPSLVLAGVAALLTIRDMRWGPQAMREVEQAIFGGTEMAAIEAEAAVLRRIDDPEDDEAFLKAALEPGAISDPDVSATVVGRRLRQRRIEDSVLRQRRQPKPQ